MAGATPEHDVLLADGGASHFCSSGCGAFVLDDDTGERRLSTLDDLRKATALLDASPEVDLIWTTVTANDVPLEVRERMSFYTMLTQSDKHVTFVDCPSQVEPLLRIAEIVGGDLDGVPRAAAVQHAAHRGLTAAGRRRDARLPHRRGRPRRAGQGLHDPDVGGDGAGHHGRRRHPRRRRVHGRRHGGAERGARRQAAVRRVQQHHGHARGARLLRRRRRRAHGRRVVEVGHLLGVPVAVAGIGTDAKHPGIQAGYEKALHGLTSCAAGADMLSGGVGMLDSVDLLYLPQIVDRLPSSPAWSGACSAR